MNKPNFYFCYDQEQSRYLIHNGASPVTTAINPKSLTKFVLFIVDDTLKSLVDEYKALKQLQSN